MPESGISKNFIMNSTVNNTINPETEALLKLPGVKIALLFTTAGTVFCLANIFLVLYFTGKKHFIKTTHIFLCNLGVSDIILGAFVLVFGITLFFPSFTQLGRIALRVGMALASNMSALCILMISFQVSSYTFQNACKFLKCPANQGKPSCFSAVCVVCRVISFLSTVRLKYLGSGSILTNLGL